MCSGSINCPYERVVSLDFPRTSLALVRPVTRGYSRRMSAQLDIAAWRSAASATFGQLDVRPAPDVPFHAEMGVARLGEISLFDMHTSAHNVVRTDAHISADESPFCKLSLQISGTSTMTQDGRTCTLHPGDLALYVTQRPYSLDYPSEQNTLIVHFPQHYLRLTPAQIAQITATPISRGDGLGRVAVPLFEELAANLDVLSGPHAESLVRSALNMLVSAFSSERSDEFTAGSDLLFNQARSYIDRNLSDAALSPGTIAAALFVSVRHLHARFAAHDLSVAAYIRSQRLDRIHTELIDHPDEPIATIAARYGMHDPSHFSRAFKAAYGLAPRAYRAQHTA